MPWKRLCDIVMSSLALVILLPLFGLIGLAVYLDSGPPVFYTQSRMGRGFARFRLWKFRTMVDAPGPSITIGADGRVTRMGRFLRAVKLDELPQFWNVLRGDMSIVGPRPELPRYVEAFHDRYQVVLRVRPGITDLASLRFRDEAVLLGSSSDPFEEYTRRVLPAKLDLAEHYVRNQSFLLDLSIIVRTVLTLARVLD